MMIESAEVLSVFVVGCQAENVGSPYFDSGLHLRCSDIRL